jgi:hypothetical protein
MAQVEKDSITLVAPNGQPEQERYHPNQTVGHVLKKAVDDFAKAGLLDPARQYVLVMAGVPLSESQTLAAAGVVPGARLSVRAKDIPGDGNCTLL